MTSKNLWQLGEDIAENPSMWTRVKHSSKGTSVRRVVKASNFPKAIAKGGAMALKQVPIPILKDVLVAIVNKAYDMGKSYHRKKYQIDTANTDAERAKFGWKDMDVKDMDRYRWKVADSIQALNKTTTLFNQRFAKYAAEGKACDAYIHITKDYAYSRKRIQKLRTKALAIKLLAEHTLSWLDDADDKLNTWTRTNRSDLVTKFSGYGPDAHENCDKTVCALKDDVKRRLNHGTAMNRAAGLGSVIIGAIDPLEVFDLAKPKKAESTTEKSPA